MEYFITFIYGILAVVGIAIVYIATSGRAWFGTKEKPEKVLGEHLKIKSPDGLGPQPPELPEAIATHFESNKYKLDFVKPIQVDNRTENYVIISARHAGYPVSCVKKHGILGINATLESGTGFIASLVRA